MRFIYPMSQFLKAMVLLVVSFLRIHQVEVPLGAHKMMISTAMEPRITPLLTTEGSTHEFEKSL